MKEIQIEISHICPLNCIHCSSKDLRLGKISSGITIQSLERFISQIPGDKQVNLTGGEPLSYPTLLELCQTIHEIPQTRIGLFTCGVYEKERKLLPVSIFDAQILHASGVEDCYISVYGKEKNAHNYFTRKPSFDLTCESIQNLQAAGIQTHAHIVLSRQTVDELHDLLCFICTLGMKSVRVLRLVKHGSAEDNWELIGTDIDIQESTIRYLIANQDNFGINVSVSGFPSIIPCRPIKNAIGCQRAISLLYVTFSGEIYPCACAKGNHGMELGSLDYSEQAIAKLKEYEDISYYPTCINAL